MKINKKWKIGLLFLGGLILTGCTKSFGTIQDQANVLVQYEQAVVQTTETGTKTNLDVIIENVNATGEYYAPTEAFFDYVEEKVADKVVRVYSHHTIALGNNETKSYSELTVADLCDNQEIRSYFVKTNEYALVKYAKENSTSLEDLWSNYNMWTKTAIDDGLSLTDVGSTYYHDQMKAQFSAHLNTVTAYITPVDRDFEGLKLEGKSWGDAFSFGLIEGLLVWPISALLYYLSVAFSGMGPFGTILAVFLVTLIVRGVLLLATFKQTASQQKMNEIQPEMAKIQAKYPNANTNQYEKQQMAMEQMALYKKHKINPFGMFIVLIFQFPIFIAVWGAMSGSAILRTGNIGGLSLAANTGSSITTWTGQPSVVALVIFIIMALTQAVSMLLPQYIQKRKTQKVAKMTKNPSADSSAMTMKIMNWVMLAMIIIMGFQLPVAMAIYWIISALISLTQSLIMNLISSRKNKNNGNFAKYKTKKAAK